MSHLKFAAIGWTKSTAAQMAIGKRVRMESLEPPAQAGLEVKKSRRGMKK